MRNQRIIEQKGMLKVASEFDQLSVSNRGEEERIFSSLSSDDNAMLASLLDKEAGTIEQTEGIQKQSFFTNGLGLFTQTRRMLSEALGVSEDVANDMTSSVLNKSQVIHERYGGDQTVIVNGLIDAMKGHAIENPELLNGNVEIHPMRHNSKKKIEEEVKQKLIKRFSMPSNLAEPHRDLIMREAQDLAVILRPHKREEIALAVTDVICEIGDLSIAYGFKSNDVLVQSTRDLL